MGPKASTFPSLLAGVLSLAALAPSQTRHLKFMGATGHEYLGASVALIGDLNRDGFADVMIGAFGNGDTGVHAGQTLLRSGRDGSILFTFDAGQPEYFLGFAIARGGDINGDGYEDLLIGAPYNSLNGPESGTARVYSGQDGSLLYSYYGLHGGDKLGMSLSAAGDADDDGYADFLIAAPHDADAPQAAGSVRLYSGKDGTVLHTFFGKGRLELFGQSVSAVGDLDRDGHDDVLITAPQDEIFFKRGRATVFSGRNGSIIHEFIGAEWGHQLGWSAAGIGDVDGDDYPDLLIGSPGANNSRGQVRVFSGRDRSEIYFYQGNAPFERLGDTVGSAGDVDADGVPDFIIGAPLSDRTAINAGHVEVHSGRTGALLYIIFGEVGGEEFGESLDGGADIDGDGYDDLVTGSWRARDNGESSGSASVFLSPGGDAPGFHRIRGAGCPGSDGRLAHIEVHGHPAIGNNIELALRGARPGSIAILLAGVPVNRALDNLGAPGCALLVLPPSMGPHNSEDFFVLRSATIARSSDASGRARVSLSIPDHPELIGMLADLQWAIIDQAANPLGAVLSDAVRIHIGR